MVYDMPGFAVVDGTVDAGGHVLSNSGHMWTHSHSLLPGCGVELKMEGRKRLLTRETMPGDASRGIEVPPLIVTVMPHDDTPKRQWDEVIAQRTRIYVQLSDSFLVSLPIPDASMPFNVLTLVR
jgi:hypothetical protein